ncbi:esterase-like activity of phytase family protein [Pseudoalteromonas luteoviolacea]|uniref:esterase-like activity of phytase family protein n=1 Tax=Pseudoalteromonas luteoviolacea TaxID=43657 RepID=UPI001B3A1A0A|nr:esterase-like activity of phytase family protein [Pseudoalteromonas luteoviolacea]MBQ4878263.1 esterase-like activity of phytase family protein [Pseudoalteromonas luteoviolacea]MBQ4907418.1 esterase-like activity of phytase family protein [Pseudoalteromonas luteoviolacea]
MKKVNLSLIACSLMVFLSACSGDDGKNGLDGLAGNDGADGTSGSDGKAGLVSLVNQQKLSMADSQCFFGGIALHSGVDINSNSLLDDSEVNQTNYVCTPTPINAQGSKLPHSALRTDLQNGSIAGSRFEIRNGGYGSDMVAHPSIKHQFYALTDRGPNATYTGDYGKGKTFPTPDYTPRIGLFELTTSGAVLKLRDILLKRPDGAPISGLPNASDLGGTGETPYTVDGNPILVDQNQPYHETQNPIKLDNYGLDGEGLVALSDGSFWVSDEYGPHIVHFDNEGKEIERINAFAHDERTVITLPNEYAKRRANRGMEGLAITPDETTLVGIMQSTMYNPDNAVKALDITRIVTINLKTKQIGQYLYQQEKAQNSNSGIVALSNTEFLVIERDGAFYGQTPDAMKRIYKIDLTDATNLEQITPNSTLVQDDNLGLLIAGQTLEQAVLTSGWETLTTHGITPVSKSLVLDLIQEVQYPHDKLEGMWLIDNSRLAVLNDDDFATWSTDGVLEQKYLDATKSMVDSNTLYFFENLALDK